MFATSNFVLERFNRFNESIFGGKLSLPSIVLTRAKKCLGKCEFYSERSLFGVRRNFNYSIKITGAVDLPENELEDIVIHEMIHYHIAVNSLKDSSTHGYIFKSMMNDINARYGRHVSVYHRISSDENSNCSQTEKHYILCISSLSDGKRGVTVCAKTRFFEIYKMLPKYYKIDKIDLYLSYDSFFDRYPRSNKACIYKISSEDVEIHLKDAKELVIEHGVLKLK